jgi:peptidoglycan/LPS O-acetylase OafA/YrhL
VSRRFESLDGLRGIAAIGVVLFHVRWSNHVTETHFIREGYLFVDLFFILSGFIIARAYCDQIRTGQQAVRFLILRFSRIYPLHIAVLFIFFLLEVAKLFAAHFGLKGVTPFQGSTSGWAAISNLFLVESLTFSGSPTWNVPSWSISCEAVAYVVFAGAAMAGLVNKRHFAHWVIIAATILYAIVLCYKGSLFALVDLGGGIARAPARQD